MTHHPGAQDPSPDSADSRRCAQNTDTHLWRESSSDWSPSVHATLQGGIGMNVGGHVIVAPVERWHAVMKSALATKPEPVSALTRDWGPAAVRSWEATGHEGCAHPLFLSGFQQGWNVSGAEPVSARPAATSEPTGWRVWQSQGLPYRSKEDAEQDAALLRARDVLVEVHPITPSSPPSSTGGHDTAGATRSLPPSGLYPDEEEPA